MTIKAIIFDFGGVLNRMVDESPRHRLAERWNVPLDKIYRLLFDGPTALPAARGELPVGDHWAAVLTSLNIPLTEQPAFIQQFWSADALDHKLVEYIRGLRPRYKIGLLSNAFDDLRQVLRERWGVDDLFDEMIISAEVGLVKPDRRIYELAISRFGVQPAEAVFVDDMPENVTGAQAVGLHAIQFSDLDQTRRDLAALLEFNTIQ